MDTLQVVVTRYKENITWLGDHDNVKIYQKVDGLQIPYLDNNITYIPNYGKDAYTHLYHIVNNYNCLADFTLFTQATPHEHDPEFTIGKFKNKDFLGVCVRNGNWCGDLNMPFHGWGRIIHHDKWLKEIQSGELIPAKTTYGEYWDKYIQKPKPDPSTMIWYHGIIFSASKEKILQHNKQYYIDLLSTVDGVKNNEEIHYFERSIHYIFN